MKRNEGTLDRWIRVLVAVVAIVGGYVRLHGIWQIVIYVIGVIALLTSITGFCGLYTIFHISTYKKK